MTTIRIKVQGMTCGGCEKSIQNALTGHAGVKSAAADRNEGIVTVDFDPDTIQPRALEKAIIDAGFEVSI